MSYSTLAVGARVRLATYAPGILGSRFDDLTVTGTLAFGLANRLRDVVVAHNSVYDSLPSGVPVDAKDLEYVSFVNNVTNEELILAKAWIDENSIEVLTSEGITFTVKGTATGDIDRIRSGLADMGFTQVTFSAN